MSSTTEDDIRHILRTLASRHWGETYHASKAQPFLELFTEEFNCLHFLLDLFYDDCLCNIKDLTIFFLYDSQGYWIPAPQIQKKIHPDNSIALSTFIDLLCFTPEKVPNEPQISSKFRTPQEYEQFLRLYFSGNHHEDGAGKKRQEDLAARVQTLKNFVFSKFPTEQRIALYHSFRLIFSKDRYRSSFGAEELLAIWHAFSGAGDEMSINTGGR